MRQSKTLPSPLPESHLRRAQALGLRAVCYLNTSREVADGSREWLPRDLIGDDARSLIVWRPAGEDSGYGVAGYHPWHDGMFGGCYPEIHNALAWIERAKAVRAGTARDFLGV